MRCKGIFLLLASLVICWSILALGCDTRKHVITVYSGKGLKKALDEVKQVVEPQLNVELNIVYAGSDILLKTIQKTRKGDLFIPGSLSYIKQAQDLVESYSFVALHVPAFAVRQDNQKNINTYADLSRKGVKIAVGNKEMCAIGKVGDVIINRNNKSSDLMRNIVITASTVNELLKLLNHGEVDAALIWEDMLQWPEAQGLRKIEIPAEINEIKEINVAVLTTTGERRRAGKVAEFLATQGKVIFQKHGFGGR